MNLELFTFVFFIAVNVLMMIYWLYRSPSRGYNFPFFAGAIALAVVFPQGVAFYRQMFLLPPNGFWITMLFASLCMIAVWAGFAIGLKQKGETHLLSRELFSDKTLMRCATIFIILGAGCYIKLDNMDIQIDAATGNWTGAATIYSFFSQWLKIGFVVALFVAVKTKKPWAWILVGVALCFILPAVFIRGRRADAMTLLTSVLMLLWFVRHRAVPRWCFVAIVVCMVFAMSAIGAFRSIMKDSEYDTLSYLERIELVNWTEMLSGTMENGGGCELLNCIYGVSAADQLMQFDFGVPFWNLIVWSFVPGQWVGSDVKQLLYIWVNWPFYKTTYDCYPNYISLTGSMWLGYTDAFQSFWWLGWMVFFVISWFMGYFYRLADSGNSGAVCLYTWIFTPTLHIIPALTFVFWTNLIFLLLFCFPIVLLCRSKQTASAAGKY